jgi:hypothetical protein
MAIFVLQLQPANNMFNFFRKPKENNVGPKNWVYDIYPGFRLINNGDSIQYVNDDGSRIIYLSVLIISGSSLLTSTLFKGEPDITNNANGWQLKGTTRLPNEAVVCVINFTHEDDVDWAKGFFDSIKPKV